MADQTSTGSGPAPPRQRPPRSRRPSEDEAASPPQPASPTPIADPAQAPPRPRRRHRAGRRHRRSGQGQAAIAPPAPAAAPAPTPEPQPQAAAPARPRRRRGQPRRDEQLTVEPPPAQAPSGPRFAHPSEAEFAGILDFYGIQWEYEPRTFPLRWEHGHVAEAFTPDFYLNDLNLYVEVTTLKTGLTADKSRKARLLKQLYPEVNIRLLKKRDLLRLLTKYGYGPLAPEEVPDVDRILIPTARLQQRVADLGAQISRDYAGKEPVLVGVLRGVLCFMADLVRHLSLSVTVDFMAVSAYEGDSAGSVKILKDLDENIKGRDVILVEDIVDTGMTLNHVLEYLWSKKPASLRVCALLDKSARRLANVELDYVGFEIPDEFVVGYGLDFRQRYRNLPFVAVLKHELLP